VAKGLRQQNLGQRLNDQRRRSGKDIGETNVSAMVAQHDAAAQTRERAVFNTKRRFKTPQSQPPEDTRKNALRRGGRCEWK
jgi:hypothetical protein